MKKIYLTLILICISLISANYAYSQTDTLKLEYGILVNSTVLLEPPNTIDGWGSAGGGIYGDSLVFYMAEQNDSYTNNLSGSSWICYGEMMSKMQYPVIEDVFGFYPDTIVYSFLSNTEIYVRISDAVGNIEELNSTYEIFDGVGQTEIDSFVVTVDNGGVIGINSHIIQINNHSVFAKTENIINNKINVYPNPAENVIYIETPQIKGNSTIELFDLTGKKVISQRYTDIQKVRFNTEKLKSGLYFIKLSNKKESHIQKIIIK